MGSEMNGPDTGDTEGSTLSPSKQRTVFFSLCFDILLWIPEIAAVILSGSVTMFADVLKCGNEILATFIALLLLMRMRRNAQFSYDYGMGKFETITRNYHRRGDDDLPLHHHHHHVSPDLQSRTPSAGRCFHRHPAHDRFGHRRYLSLEEELSDCAARSFPCHGIPVEAPEGQDFFRHLRPPLAHPVVCSRNVCMGSLYRSDGLLYHHRLPAGRRIPGTLVILFRISLTRHLKKNSSWSYSGNCSRASTSTRNSTASVRAGQGAPST